jgi:hypothetical protein
MIYSNYQPGPSIALCKGMITIGTYAFVLFLLLAMDRANNLLATKPRPSGIVSESSAVRIVRVRAFGDALHRDLMRWENEGGRIHIDEHKTPGGHL